MPRGSSYSQMWVKSSPWEIAFTTIELPAHHSKAITLFFAHSGWFQANHLIKRLKACWSLLKKKKNCHKILLLKRAWHTYVLFKTVIKKKKNTHMAIYQIKNIVNTLRSTLWSPSLSQPSPWVCFFDTLPLQPQQGFLARILWAQEKC